jgi:hypothetical protein
MILHSDCFNCDFCGKVLQGSYAPYEDCFYHPNCLKSAQMQPKQTLSRAGTGISDSLKMDEEDHDLKMAIAESMKSK